MKICIIGHTEKSYLPYIDKYIEFFKLNKIEYDIIYWERENRSQNPPTNEHSYYEKPQDSAFSKLTSYFRYRKHVIKVLEENKYDKLVILTTVPAIFLKGYLQRNYKNKYLFDFRDYSFEKYKPYKNMVDSLIDSSELTTISSQGFMEFLEENKKIIINHNIPVKLYDAPMNDLKNAEVINIGFIGVVRYYDANIELIDSLKDASNYHLWYIGKAAGDCDIESYCKENEIANVSFKGKYSNDEKPDLYKRIDMINSVYGNDSVEVVTLLPNRLYETCMLKKPIIASKGTFLGAIVDQYGLGVSVDASSENILETLNEYIKTFDEKSFLQGCESFLVDVKQDEAAFYKHLEKFIQK